MDNECEDIRDAQHRPIGCLEGCGFLVGMFIAYVFANLIYFRAVAETDVELHADANFLGSMCLLSLLVGLLGAILVRRFLVSR